MGISRTITTLSKPSQHLYQSYKMAALTSSFLGVAAATKLAVSNGTEQKANAMMVWRPHGNKMFETFSFLPPLSDADLSKQVQYLWNNGWTPCLEFEDPAHAYTDGHGNSGLDSSINTNYYDNRYWVMWKLPMYGCNDPSEVLTEVKACVKAFPNCYVRCAGFDNIKQVQCHSFLVYRPKLSPMEGGARDVADRQI